MAIYYLDGDTLSNSSAVFTDESMTTCAPDGFYSDGTIVRELSGCSLLPAEDCPNCGETITVASIRLVNGDCTTGDPSSAYSSIIYVNTNFVKFTEVGGVLLVDNGLSINEPVIAYDPTEPNISIAPNSQDTRTDILAPSGTYLISNDSLTSLASSVEAAVGLPVGGTQSVDLTTCGQ